MNIDVPRASLLSDHEVLSLLRDLETQQKASALRPAPAVAGTPASALLAGKNGLLNPLSTSSTSTASVAQAIADSSDQDAHLALIPSNLRTVQYEALKYLTNVTRPCAHQSPKGIAAFTAALKEWEKAEGLEGARLTKGERLMCVNHRPKALVELHTIVEELDMRFSEEQMDALLALIAEHLPAPTSEEEAEALDDSQLHTGAIQDGNEMYEHDEQMEELENAALARENEIAEAAEEDELVDEGRGEGAVDDDGPEEE